MASDEKIQIQLGRGDCYSSISLLYDFITAKIKTKQWGDFIRDSIYKISVEIVSKLDFFQTITPRSLHDLV